MKGKLNAGVSVSANKMLAIGTEVEIIDEWRIHGGTFYKCEISGGDQIIIDANRINITDCNFMTERNKTMETEVLKTGNYYIEREGEKIKITLIDSRHRNISVVPSSGNAIIVKPESSGVTQFETESKTTCLRDKDKICNQCHECDVDVLNPNY